jgi:hypothetical protein
MSAISVASWRPLMVHATCLGAAYKKECTLLAAEPTWRGFGSTRKRRISADDVNHRQRPSAFTGHEIGFGPQVNDSWRYSQSREAVPTLVASWRFNAVRRY